jgi:virginiamycin B lyase
VPVIREHRIPTPGSKPYIITLGPDGNLWFCESGVSRIARLSLKDGTFTEFVIPTRNSEPIGIITGADGNLWFT